MFWTWLIENWMTVAIATIAVASALNKATARWDQLRGFRKILGALTEFLSVLTSSGYRTSFGGHLKLPGQVKAGRPIALGGPAAPQQSDGGFVSPPALALCLIGLLALGLFNMGCANWNRKMRTSIVASHEALKSQWRISRAILHKRCMEALAVCTNRGERPCQGWIDCDVRRSNLATATVGAQSALLSAQRTLDALEQLSGDEREKAVDVAKARAESALKSANRVQGDLEREVAP